MFNELLAQLQAIGADAWAFGIGVLLIIAALVMLYRAIQATAAAGFGSGPMIGAAIMGIIGVFLIVAAAFDLIPSFTQWLGSRTPEPPFPH